MPRSYADRFERSSLSRSSVGKCSLGRYSIGTDISASSAATRHWVNSVSDIYGPDEIEELLDDLNKLELAALEASDDFQDYDIDGSQIGMSRNPTIKSLPLPTPSAPPSASIVSTNSSMKRPQDRIGTTTFIEDEIVDNKREEEEDEGEEAEVEGGSPTHSINSWDSHAHYQRFRDPRDDLEEDPTHHPSSPMQSIICYCDMSTFKTPRTILRVLLVATSVACLSTVLTAGTAKSGIFALPHFPRLRLIIFISIFTILFTLFILFLNISHLHALLPIEYGKMQTVVYLLLTVAYIASSSLLLHLQSELKGGNFFSPLPHWTKNHLIIGACLGFVCSLETFLCCFNPSPTKIQESLTHYELQDTPTSREGGGIVGKGGIIKTTKEKKENKTRKKKGGEPVISSSSRRFDSLPATYTNTEQYLVNENYFTSSHPHRQRHNDEEVVAALGAIPKRHKQRTNTTDDEIIALPLDDLGNISSNGRR